jgi:hypothetical protein
MESGPAGPAALWGCAPPRLAQWERWRGRGLCVASGGSVFCPVFLSRPRSQSSETQGQQAQLSREKASRNCSVACCTLDPTGWGGARGLIILGTPMWSYHVCRPGPRPSNQQPWGPTPMQRADIASELQGAQRPAPSTRQGSQLQRVEEAQPSRTHPSCCEHDR